MRRAACHRVCRSFAYVWEKNKFKVLLRDLVDSVTYKVYPGNAFICKSFLSVIIYCLNEESYLSP